MTGSPSRSRPPETTDRRRTAEVQYDIIKERIVSGNVDPRTTLYETTLSVEMGVSRTPIREALRLLEQDGLLVRRTRGYQLKVSTPEDIVNIYDVRIALEAAAAASAAQRRTELDLAQLRNQHADAQKRLTNSNGTENANFHRVVWAASHNPVLIELLDNIDIRVRALDKAPLVRTQNLATTFAEHKTIIDAIHRQQADIASTVMRTHLQRTRDIRLEAITKHLS